MIRANTLTVTPSIVRLQGSSAPANSGTVSTAGTEAVICVKNP